MSDTSYFELIDPEIGFYDIHGRQIMAVEVVIEEKVEDNSFDYAGTHCTGGRSGTHVQIDRYREAISIEAYEWERALEEGRVENHIVPKFIDEETEEEILEHINQGLNQ